MNLLLKYDADQFKANNDGHTAFNVAEQRLRKNPKDPRRQRILDVLLKC